MGRKLALSRTGYAIKTDTDWQVEQAVKATQYVEAVIEREAERMVLRFQPPLFAGVEALARVEGGSTEMPKFRGESS